MNDFLYCVLRLFLMHLLKQMMRKPWRCLWPFVYWFFSEELPTLCFETSDVNTWRARGKKRDLWASKGCDFCGFLYVEVELKPKPTDSSMKLLKFQRAGGTKSEQLLGWDLFLWCRRLFLNMRFYFHHTCQCEWTKWFHLMRVYRTDESYIIAQTVSKYLFIKWQCSLFFFSQ